MALKLLFKHLRQVMTDSAHPLSEDVTVSSAADIPWAWPCSADVMSASLSLVVGSAWGTEEEEERGGGLCGACDRLPVTSLTALWKIAVLAERGGAAARLHAPVSLCVEASWAEQTEVTAGSMELIGATRGSGWKIQAECKNTKCCQCYYHLL